MIEGHLDLQTAFNMIVALAGVLGGWVLGRITRALDQLDADVRLMPDKYVTKIDYKADIQEVKNVLNRIYDKLDGKADK